MVAGVLFLLMSIFKLGWIAEFLTRAVVTGFLLGAAIDVIVGELSKVTGTEAEGTNAWREAWSWMRGLDATHGTTLLVGTISLVLLFGLRVVAPKSPERWSSLREGSPCPCCSISTNMV